MDSKALHETSIVIDAHCDSLQAVARGERRLTERSAHGEVDLPRLREAGVTAQVFAVFVEPERRCQATVEALRLIDAFYAAVADADGRLVMATTAADVEQAKREGKVAGILSLEGAEPLEGDLAVLRMFYRLGVRAVGLTWNHRNQAGDGVGESRTGGGLTEFGVALVKEMNRLGMLVDVAHLSPRGLEDVLKVSEAPVIASHANAWALCPHQRNLTDEQLIGIARSGGLVGVTFYTDFLVNSPQRATLDAVIDHIDHLVSVIGAAHVALGSDFDGFMGMPPPTGLEDVTHLPSLTMRLLARGYSEADVRKILGENFLRVFRQVAG